MDPLPSGTIDAALGWNRRIPPTLMEVYRQQTQQILKRFLDREITFPECIAALDHALAGASKRCGLKDFQIFGSSCSQTTK
jgi:hypothetical protein